LEEKAMPLADEIRKYCIDNYIMPARLRREKGVFITSGEIHRNMNLTNRLSAVCTALGSNKFEDEAGVKRVQIEGPLNASNTTFVFIFK
jgi:5-methylcytosine-specific restriction protein B